MILDQKAVDFATRFHGDQKRKYTNEPYINHCLSVARIVLNHGGNFGMVCAAILHDTIEDTPATLNGIQKEFGPVVAKLVEELTDVYTSEAYPDMNRRARKLMECERIAGISNEAKTIKLADLIDNTSSIVEYDIDFAKTYLREKSAMLDVLAGGNPALHRRAIELLHESLQKLIAV
jgi:(p)ppGpp synthase/HD superfamily hydrolase